MGLSKNKFVVHDQYIKFAASLLISMEAFLSQ